MPTKDQLTKALVNAHNAGDAAAAKKLANAIKAMDAKPDQGSAADPLAQGITFGFADEALAALMAIPAAYQTDTSIGDAYTGLRDQMRGQNAAFAERNPKTAMGLEIAGGALTGGLGASKAVATQGGRAIAKSMPKLMATGAASGGVAGLGYSEADDLAGMGKDALTGAAVGAAGAAILPPLAKATGRAITAPMRHYKASQQGKSARIIGQAIERDDTTANKVAAQLRKMPDDAALVDAGGENLQALGRDISVQPGKARNVARKLFEGRRGNAPQRIDAAVRQATGRDEEFYPMLRALEESMKKDSGPLYRAAFERPIRYTPQLKALLNRDSMKKAMRQGEKLAVEEGDAIGGNMQMLDYAKRALDDQIGTLLRAGNKQKARAVINTKNTLLRELDLQNPVYKKAREAYAGPAAAKEAMELGRKFLRDDAEEITEFIADLSASEKEFFRLGAIRALRDKVLSKSDTADAVKSIYHTPALREKVKAILPDRNARAKFERAMRSESKMFESQTKAMANSSTANKQAGVADLAQDPGVMVDFARGDVAGPAIQAAKTWLRNHVGALKDEKIRDEVAKMLFNADPQQRMAIIQRINARNQAVEFGQKDLIALQAALSTGPAANQLN